ncbi:hypothetical protein [Caldithrix abyssi]
MNRVSKFILIVAGFALAGVALAGIVVFLSCAKKEATHKETLVARVKDRTISVNEFIRRAEYTIRPAYCRGDNYIHRKIVLNSLIAEKLMALEAGENNELTNNHEFQQYLLGRKEQAMRQWLFYEVGIRPVKLDTAEIRRLYSVAGRVYRVSFLNCPDHETAHDIYRKLTVGKISFEQMARELSAKKNVPQKEIKFDAPEPDVVHQALYEPSIKKGQLIGPLEVAPDSYVILRVDGWRSYPALTDQQQADRLKQVKDKLTERQAIARYEKFIGQLMGDKKLQFNPEIFKRLVNILGPEYFKTEKEKKEMFNKKFWNKDNEMMVRKNGPEQLGEMAGQTFFTVDGQAWTVERFMYHLQRHPLVFRRKKFPQNQFARHFRQAVADMIRDYYLTRVAYERGYDKIPEVQRYEQMWKDNLLALYHKKQYLDRHVIKGKKGMAIIKEVLDPYVAQLRQKYQDQIEINTDAFEKIKLTRIDMFAIQPNQAFPVVVPSFPQLTTHNMLDYGRKMDYPESGKDL